MPSTNKILALAAVFVVMNANARAEPTTTTAVQALKEMKMGEGFAPSMDEKMGARLASSMDVKLASLEAKVEALLEDKLAPVKRVEKDTVHETGSCPVYARCSGGRWYVRPFLRVRGCCVCSAAVLGCWPVGLAHPASLHVTKSRVRISPLAQL